MRRLKIVSGFRVNPVSGGGFRRCPMWVRTLANGETLKRGCGRRGLVPFEAGWRCYYCGNYLYRDGASLDSLWFHFRLGREYWRQHTALGLDYINGIPAPGGGDLLPRRWAADLNDPRPPRWFASFLQSDDREFRRLLRDGSL